MRILILVVILLISGGAQAETMYTFKRVSVPKI